MDNEFFTDQEQREEEGTGRAIDLDKGKIYKSEKLNSMLWHLDDEGITWITDNITEQDLANMVTGPDGMDSELVLKLGGLMVHLDCVKRFKEIAHSIPFDAPMWEESRD